jgi:hypothetical protein
MSAPLGENSPGGDGRQSRRPTEHQLQMARIRARTTGESVEQVLSVFMGGGRHGQEAGSGPTGPEAVVSGEVAGTYGHLGEARDGDEAEHLARVIPLSRAASLRREEED